MVSLRELRSERGLSQEKLADIAGVSDGTVSDIECHRTFNPTHSTIKKLAKALNVDPSEIEESRPRWQQQCNDPMTDLISEKRGRAINFVESLSKMQLRVLNLLARGYLNEKIANELGIRHKTVKIHIGNIYGKLKPEEGEYPRTLAVVFYMLAFEQGQSTPR